MFGRYNGGARSNSSKIFSQLDSINSYSNTGRGVGGGLTVPGGGLTVPQSGYGNGLTTPGGGLTVPGIFHMPPRVGRGKISKSNGRKPKNSRSKSAAKKSKKKPAPKKKKSTTTTRRKKKPARGRGVVRVQM